MSPTTPSISEPQSLDEAREIIASAREILTEFVGVLGAQQQRIEELEAQVDELHVYLRRICTEQLEMGWVTTMLPLGGRCLPAA